MHHRFLACFFGFVLVVSALVMPPASAVVPPEPLRYACAGKTSGVLRYIATPGPCAANEVLVTFSVAAPILVCVGSDGSVRKVSKTGDCKKTKGTTRTIPSGTPAYFCVGSNLLLRSVQDPSQCKAGETAYVVVNTPPSDITLSPSDIDENEPSGSTVGTLSATDPDVGFGDSLTFALVSGTGSTDNSKFSIDGTTLKTTDAFDYETNTSFSIRVRVTDAGSLFNERQLTVTVNDIAENDPPTDIALSNATVAENELSGTTVGTLNTTDPDVGDTHTYTLVDIAGVPNDNGSFQISGSTLQTSEPLDHEGVGPTYDVSIRTDDGNGGTFEETFTITVTDVNDAPTDIALSNASVGEGQSVGTTVGTLTATDQDAGDSHSFSLVAGAGDSDNGSFQISGSTLQTNAVFDFETKSSYTIRVRANDGNGGTFEEQFTITVTDGNDAPTDIGLTPSSIDENEPSGTNVGTLSATDPDPADTHTFTLVAGAGDEGNASFTISGDSLLSAAVFDFETQDSYSIRVRADDGNGGTFEKQLTVTIGNANEAPTALNLDDNAVPENLASGTAVGTLSTVDDPGDTHTYTLVSGTGDDDNGSFSIDVDQLETAAVFDFETKSSYSVRVRTTDGDGNSIEAAFTISVTNVNEAPTDIALSNASVNENEPFGTAVGTLSDTDPDVGDTAAYTFVSGTGDTDNALFSIDGTTLKIAVPFFNYEEQSSYSVRIRVTDSGLLTFDEAFTITIIDVNDPPVAEADSYSGAIGNTTAVLGTTGTGPHVVLTGNVITDNDSDEDLPADTLAVTAETVSSTSGGTATINADGSFVFLPGVGDENQPDTFSYQLSDGTVTVNGTVTVGIGTELVWYVDRDAASNGDGRSSSPLQNLAGVNGAGGAGDADGTSDWIFLYDSTSPYTGGIPLETNQKLYGEKAGLVVDGHNLVAAGGSNSVVQNSGGTGIALAEGTSVRAVNVGTSSGAGITAAGVNSASVGGAPGGTTTVSGVAGADISVSGGTTGGITFDTNVTNTSGRSVVVTGRTGGTITLNGAIADTGTGVDLTSNTGAAVDFLGGLTLSTGSSQAFFASGGGTINVNGTGNTIVTTTGTPLQVLNTIISASGLNFRSISSTGAVNGIVLDNTGTFGSLVVSGNSAGSCGGVVNPANGVMVSGPDLADCTGGSILNSVGPGVLLSATKGVALQRVRIANSGGDGISGTSLTGGFTLNNSVLTNNGNVAEENGVDLGNSASLTPQGVTGLVSIDNSTVTGSADSNVSLRNSSGTATVSVGTSRIAGAGVVPGTQDGVQVAAFGTASIGLTVEGNSFSANKGDHVQVLSGNGAGGSGTFTAATIRHNTMTGGASGALGQGITVSAAGEAPLWSGSLKYDIDGNSVNGAISYALTVDLGRSGAGGLMSGFVRNNNIGTIGVALSCSAQADGLFLDAQGSGTHTVSITGNTIRRCFDRGISLATGDGNGNLNATVTSNTVTELADTNAGQGTPRQAFIGQFGTTSTNILGGVDSSTTCLSLSGNAFTGGAFKDGDIRLRQRFRNRVLLPGYAGTAFDDTAVQAHLVLNNVGSTAAVTHVDDAGSTTEGYFGGGSCALPTP